MDWCQFFFSGEIGVSSFFLAENRTDTNSSAAKLPHDGLAHRLSVGLPQRISGDFIKYVRSCKSHGSATMKCPLDFVRKYDFTRGWAIINAPDIVDSARLSKLAYTNERALCAVRFAANSSFGVKDDPSNVYRQGYLRASLAEFVGMEEALQVDLSRGGINEDALRLDTSQSPLLRSIRELRNMRIHMLCREILEDRMQVVYLDQQQEWPMWLVTDWTEAGFKELKNSRHYDDATITSLVLWFNDAQRHFGIQDLVIRAVAEYSATIVSAYRL